MMTPFAVVITMLWYILRSLTRVVSEILKPEAHQLVGLGQTPQHSTSQHRQTFSRIQRVITGDLAKNRTEECASMPVAPVLRTFVQYVTADQKLTRNSKLRHIQKVLAAGCPR